MNIRKKNYNKLWLKNKINVHDKKIITTCIKKAGQMLIEKIKFIYNKS